MPAKTKGIGQRIIYPLSSPGIRNTIQIKGVIFNLITYGGRDKTLMKTMPSKCYLNI